MADIYLTESLSIQNINFFTAGYKIIHFILSLLYISTIIILVKNLCRMEQQVN